MNSTVRKAVLVGIAGLAVAGGFFLLGRATADTGAAHDRGYQAGHDDGYFDGVKAGEAQGVQEGRTLQAGSVVSAQSRQPVQDAFSAGYAAGANDAFGNIDGGWDVGHPYVVVFERGAGKIAYRIESNRRVEAHVNYYLCADAQSICQEPRK